ncbi:MAG TPA: substrate-binding domain-containing protein [Arthrobacter sp.]|nr:substrate-binding domain-containing protein [Arthrobacter sp.]
MIRPPSKRRTIPAVLGILLSLGMVLAGLAPAQAANYLRIGGSGSSWAGNALQDWIARVGAQGVTVDYENKGSSTGRKEFADQMKQFAISEIPYTGDTADPRDNSMPGFSYGMLPVVAGGTAFMYNLKSGSSRMTSLKLSQPAIAKIFTGQVTRWNDPIIAAENSGTALPDATINVVVRSDGSGATAQFTLWLLRQYPADYAKLCAVTGCDPQHATSFFPTQGLKNFVAQNGSQGVTTYSANNQFTINYDEYSYAQGIGFPVAQVKNAAGFYTLPTEHAVAVALTQARINQDQGSPNYLSQDLSAVYGYKDPRSYPMSAYSYMIVPTQATNALNPSQGATLGFFANYALCEGQRPMGQLGYSPLPMNLVLAGMEQIRKIPGVDQETMRKMDDTRASVAGGSAPACNNPTFKPGDSPSANQLVRTAPFDKACDAACQAPWKGAEAAVNQGPGGTAAAGTAPDAAAVAPDTAPAEAGPAQITGPAAETAACDPDSGTCTAAAAAAGSGGTAQQLTPVTTTLASNRGWGQPQNLLLIIGGLVGLLVLVPPLAAAGLSRRASLKRGAKA